MSALDLSKRRMFDSLPFQEAGFTVRHWKRSDLGELATWPSYPFPYEAYNFSFKGKTSEELGNLFHLRENNPDTIVLVFDHESHPVMGYISLREIHWVNREAGNHGFRIEPSWCGRGVGTLLLKMVSSWCFDCGLVKLRLDVAASNRRAVRCYEKVGFVKTGEFWREAEDLKEVNLDQPRYEFLHPHIRREGDIPQIRFWWMESHVHNI
jgi:RimJ/RimL family protein N-acetyltransferase